MTKPMYSSLVALCLNTLICYIILYILSPKWIKSNNKINYTKLYLWSIVFGLFAGIIIFIINLNISKCLNKNNSFLFDII